MKKILCINLVLILLLSLFPVSAFAAGNTWEFAGGTGTDEDPYIIENATHLDNVRKYLDASFRVVKNIVFEESDFKSDGKFYNNGKGWIPIGTFESPFTGKFLGYNGNYYYPILGLKQNITASGDVYGGLFGVTNGALLSNVHIMDCDISVKSTNGISFAGALVGYAMDTQIYYCSNHGKVSAEVCGGVTGRANYTYMLGCNNEAEGVVEGLNSALAVGGVAGFAHSGTYIEQSTNKGKVNVTAAKTIYVGGIVGWLYGYNGIEGCDNTGAVYGEVTVLSNNVWANVGGIVGWVDYNTETYTNPNEIIDCRNSGSVKAVGAGASKIFCVAGGIAGNTINASIKNCYNTGDLGSSEYLGGIVGESRAVRIENCYNTSYISAATYGGGILGRSDYGTDIKNCYNTGKVTSQYNCGGIATGYATAANCYVINVCNAPNEWAVILGREGKTSNCYYLSDNFTSAGNNSNNGIALSDAEMRSGSSFGGFDFTNVWTMSGNSSYPYPELKDLNHIMPSDFAGGSGTESDPYLISNKYQLDKIREYHDSFFKLTNDIVFEDSDFEVGGAFYNNGAGWEPIGNKNLRFIGILDGAGYKISGLYQNISYNTDCHGGLFGYASCNLKNINLADVDITVTVTVTAANLTARAFVGGIVGELTQFGYIDSCSVTGSIKVNSESEAYVGGVAGVISADIKDDEIYVLGCHNGSTVTVDAEAGYTGGIVGGIDNVFLGSTYNEGKITVSGGVAMTGGVAGTVQRSTIASVYNIGKISANASSVVIGGVGGIVFNNTSVRNSYNAGEISGNASGVELLAGIIGSLAEGCTTENCYYLDNVSDGIGFFNTDDGEGVDNCVKYTADQMKSAENFAGFNFDTAWASSCNSYPKLQENVRPNITAHKWNEATANTPKTCTVCKITEGTALALESISITTLPTKTQYLEGNDELDVTGGKMKLTYDNGTTEVIDMTAEMVSGYNPDKTGSQTITVTYGGKTATFTVTVNPKSLTSIEVETTPDKTEYLEGKDTLDVDGGTIKLVYNNGTTEIVDMSLATVTGFNNSKTGDQTLTVTYKGKTTTFDVTVIAKSVVSVEISARPAKCVYLEGETLDVSGGKLKLTYDNGTSETVDMTASMVDGFNSEELGEQTLTVTYDGKTVSFDVKVINGSTAFAGGSGAVRDPYLIETAENLYNIRFYPSANYKLVTDIDFSSEHFDEGGAFYDNGKGWTPIGDTNAAFTGSFDGNGHTIEGLKISRSGTGVNYGGLFGIVDGASIKNLGVTEVNINVATTGNGTAGGGIAAYAKGNTTITSCYTSGNVKGTTYAGGLVGVVKDSATVTISTSYNAAAVEGKYAGGILGSTTGSNTTIVNCYNAGAIKCTSYAGGIAGEIRNSVTVSNCYNVGTVSGGTRGGIIGYRASSTVGNCYYLNGVGATKGVGSGTNAGTSCTAENMKSSSTYSTFDFENVWTMDGNEDYPYPELSSIVSVKVTGTAVSWNNTDDAVYVFYSTSVADEAITAEWAEEEYSGIVCEENQTPVSVSVDGKAMYEQCFEVGLKSGEYKLAIFKPGKYVPKIIEVTISGGAVDLGQQKLWLYGDVNYDGKIRAGDATQVLQYIAKTRELTEEQIAAADVTRDGKIRAGDATQIKRYIAKMESSFDSMK